MVAAKKLILLWIFSKLAMQEFFLKSKMQFCFAMMLLKNCKLIRILRHLLDFTTYHALHRETPKCNHTIRK